MIFAINSSRSAVTLSDVPDAGAAAVTELLETAEFAVDDVVVATVADAAAVAETAGVKVWTSAEDEEVATIIAFESSVTAVWAKARPLSCAPVFNTTAV